MSKTSYSSRDSQALAGPLGRREPFTTHNRTLCGTTRIDGYGILPHAAAVLLRDDDLAGTVDYVVYSYETPIAWHRTGEGHGWMLVETKFSRTTSRHQSTLRLALHFAGQESRVSLVGASSLPPVRVEPEPTRPAVAEGPARPGCLPDEYGQLVAPNGWNSSFAFEAEAEYPRPYFLDVIRAERAAAVNKAADDELAAWATALEGRR